MSKKRGLSGLISRIGRGIRASVGDMFTGPLEEVLRRWAGGHETASGAVVTPETALTDGTVYACIRLISGIVKNMPIEFKRETAPNVHMRANDHVASILLTQRPNAWMTPSAFKQLMVTWALLRGNGCALIVKVMGKPSALLPMHPDRTEIIQLPDLTVVFRYTNLQGRQAVFPASDVFHFMPFTLNGYSGVTPITYARETIGLAITTKNFGANLFRNGTHMGGVLSAPGKLGQEAIDNLQKSLDAYRGTENAGKNLVLEEGMTFKSLGLTADDAQYIQIRQFGRSDIAMFFGVPPHMIGDTGDTTKLGSSIEGMTQSFLSFTVEDYLTPFEEALNLRVINDPQRQVYAMFNREWLIKADLAARTAYQTANLQWGVWNPNTARAKQGLNPREDGKGDIYYDPPNTAGKSNGANPNEPAPTA